MNFAEAMKKETEKKYTENGALAYSTSGNGALLDFFSTCGALRSRSEEDIRNKFAAAFNENAYGAFRCLFYLRNVRGGLGERRTFRICLKWLAENHPRLLFMNLQNIALYGRFDDLLCLLDTKDKSELSIYSYVLSYIDKVLSEDIQKRRNNEPITLLAKWLPSPNTSSEKSKRYARIIYNYLGISERDYRKILSDLRSYIKVTERKMSLSQWKEIEYAKVPSYAMKNYRAAFSRHDAERYSEYLKRVSSGSTKINASTLYPYDLVRQYFNSKSIYYMKSEVDETIELLWKNLPNYVEGENNFLIMADVSGSMEGRPMETSIGLATYFAQRNTGFFKNLYMTFTNKPSFINIEDCDSLYKCIRKIKYTEMGYSTNLQAAFQKVLDTAISYSIPKEEMPKALVVISDMEIDSFFPHNSFSGSSYYSSRRYSLDFVDIMKKRFEANGYNMPKIVLWNVEARNDTFLSQDDNVIFVSGQSPSVFERLCGALEGKTAEDFMWETLNDSMYDSLYFDEHLL